MTPLRRSIDRRTRRAVSALGLAAILLGLSSTSAAAAPVLDLELSRDNADFPVVYRSDKRVDYTVTVNNSASPTPGLGDVLSCDGVEVGAGKVNGVDVPPGTPSKSWTGTDPSYFTVEWRRDGVLIPGAGGPAPAGQQYTVTAADAGKTIQCLVKGSNHGAGARYASMPGLAASPVPASAPPAPTARAGNSRPVVSGSGTAARTCTPPAGWTITATAATTAGSNQLTNVTTAKGRAELVAGSSTAILTPVESEGQTFRSGTFREGQTITSPAGGIPAGTTILAIEGETLELSAAATESKPNSNEVVAGSQPFQVGEEVVGAGIPAGTTITVIVGRTITMSNPATATATSTNVSSASTGAWAYQWLRNGEEIAGATARTYTPVIATGTASRTAGSTTLSSVVTSTGAFAAGDVITGTGLSTADGTGTLTAGSTSVTGVATTSGAFAAGQRITGAGIPAGTTIASVGAGTLELSAAAAMSGSAIRLVGNTTIASVGAGTLELSAPATSTGAAGSVVSGVDQVTNLQCRIVGANDGGALAGISNNSTVNTPSLPSTAAESANPAILFPGNSASGPVTVEVELPGGLGTYAHVITAPGSPVNNPPSPVGWSCSALPAAGSVPARATCTSTAVVLPGRAYPQIVVRTALGEDAPDHSVATATVAGGGASASDSASLGFDFAPAKFFGIEDFKSFVSDATGAAHEQAGAHPFLAGASFSFNTFRPLRAAGEARLAGKLSLIDNAKTPITDAPRGFVGNALAIKALCPSTEDVATDTCPPESAVGGFTKLYLGPALGDFLSGHVIYAIEPEFGRAAQFAFYDPASGGTYTFFPVLRPEDGYAVSFEAAPLFTYPPIGGVDIDICGFGAKLNSNNGFDGCKEATDPTANPKPLITHPTRCSGDPPRARLRADSWQNPGVFTSADSVDPMPTGCDLVKFEPEMSLEPTSHQADSPTGIDVEIFMPTDGLESKTGISQSTLKRVTVTLPEGMGVNAAAGHGLGACTAAQVGIDPDSGVPNGEEAECPDSSKIGTIGITTPLIQEKLTGDVFIAKQGRDNPFDSNIALYMVFSSKKDGITIKVSGEVKPDPVTGQMTIVFDDNPEAPFSSVELHFPQGPRSPMLNPPRCGTHTIKAELTPWSALDPDNPTKEETVELTSAYEITEGPNGGPCPDGRLDPHLNAGTAVPLAGRTSPFAMRLWRDDGTQRFTGLELSPPQGLTAYLKGVPYCPDGVLASISPDAETGQGQIDNPSCPAASQVGTASAGAGAGSDPLFVETGKVYLAGPYKGAPLSLAVVTPAVAGPLDLGNVVIRTALRVNSKTAQITAVSDPIPTILHGILLDIRDIRVAVDRPGFTLNPTNCNPMSVDARVTGDGGGSAAVSNRFQATDCAALGFKPRISLQLKGGTKRGDNPALRAVVRPRPGDANIGAAAVTLPRSAFLDQAHIRTICTRVQFAADRCPKAAIYGRAEAITPLLDDPLRGPVYLRSSDNELPDLVADLRGPAKQPIKVEAAFRTDSIRGGIRSTLDFAPDAPVTRFTLQMQGGKKGLVVNSQDLCAKTNRATAQLLGQNGRSHDFRPKVTAVNCAKQRKAKRR